MADSSTATTTSPKLADIPSLPKALGIASQEQQAEAAQLQDIFTQIGRNIRDEAALRQNVPGTLETPGSIIQKDIAQLKTQERMAMLSTAIGMSTDSAADIQAILMRDIHATTIDLRESTKRLAEQKSVSLFDDPLEALANAFVIPWTEQEVEGLDQRRKLLQEGVDKVSSSITAASVAAKALEANVTAGTIAERTAMLENLIKADKKVAEINILKNNAEAVKAAAAASKDQLQLAMQKYQYQVSEEARAFQREQRRMLLEEHQRKLKLLKDEDTANAQMFAYANLALARVGQAPFNSVAEMIQRRNLQTPAERARIDDLINKGRILSNGITALHYVDGDTPQERVKFWDTNSIRPLNKDQERFMQLNREAVFKAATEKKDGKEFKAEEWLKQEMDKLETIERGNDTNPFRAPSLGAMRDNSDIVKRSPIFNKIILPQITAGNETQSAHPDVIGPMLVSAVKAKTITPNQAATFMSQFYQSAVHLNNQQNQVERLTGLAQTKFQATIDRGADIVQIGGGALALPGAAGLAAFGHPFIAGAVGITGAGIAAAGYFGSKAKYNFIDPVQARSYIVHKITGGLPESIALPPESTTK